MPHSSESAQSPHLRLVPESPAPGMAATPRPDERELLDRALASEARAWAQLYRDQYVGLRRFVAYGTGNVDVAEDIVQETFAIALTRLADFDQRAAFSAWVRGIASNLVRKHWRKHQRRNRAHDRLEMIAERLAPPTGSDPHAGVVREQRAQALAAALEELPESQREAFTYCDIHGLSAAEVAELLGTTPGNVRVRAARARARLRKRFADLGLLSQEPAS